ncbi:MAG TPA: cysteine desulfurase [Firmicutes bacterium]|nr:cysteine desulfurase [Bacillota bacterium]
MRQIYLDNSATTPVRPEAADAMREVLLSDYGNPSSFHSLGINAERIIKEARRQLAAACGVNEAEVIFTSGGTEANNLAVKGVARRHRKRGKHLITTRVEHPSVLNAFWALEAEGFEVDYLPVDREGLVSPAEVIAALREDTLLVSVMHINNEVGSVMPVAEIGRLLKEKNPQTVFHVDAVQSFGKLPVDPRKWQADLVSISAHKIHGPKGSGALLCREGLLLEPLFHGGDQEQGIRPGTENTAGIVGFAVAGRLALRDREENYRKMAGLKKYLAAEIKRQIKDTFVNGPEEGAAHILNVTFAGIKGELLVRFLAEEGIYVSTGSACHSRRPEPSHVLLAMGLSAEEVGASVRFSFSALTGREDIDYTLEKLEPAVAALRRMTGRKK